MVAFEVRLNGKHICTAGVEKGVTSAVLAHVEGTKWQSERNLPPETTLDVGTIMAHNSESAKFAALHLRAGDELLIRIIETIDLNTPDAKLGI